MTETKIKYIKKKLTDIHSQVTIDKGFNLQDVNIEAEEIFRRVLNATYSWNLIDANEKIKNFPAIDLIDEKKEIVLQVTSSLGTKKINDTIEGFKKFKDSPVLKKYAKYQLIFCYILKEKEVRRERFLLDKNLKNDDFIDITDILNAINEKNEDDVYRKLKDIYVDSLKQEKIEISPQLTSKLGKSTLIGREKELEEIDERLNKFEVLLVRGIGGIGKSTIASYYLHSQKENFDYYGFFEGLESFISELREPLAIQQEKENDAFLEALSKLRKLKGNKLLVFDDVKDIKENQDKIEKILALKDSGYKILLTSREEIEDIEQYYLDVFSLEDAKELFNSIYPVEDEVLLEEISGYLDYHAFFVEMTAKTLKSKKTLTPKIIKEKFENGEFPTIRRKRKESFNDYLNELFSFDELDDEEILILKQFSVLPSIVIEFQFLARILDKYSYEEELEELLNYFVEIGWLNYIDGGYKLHQVIKEYILFNYKISFSKIEVIIDGL